MTSLYWAQFSSNEINEMHGVEEDVQDDNHDDQNDREESEGCGCGNCMECSGMCWSDFY